MAEERFVTEGTTSHQPLTASDQSYGPGNTRPAWVDAAPNPDTKAIRFTGSAWFETSFDKWGARFATAA
jgi:hypothetical protein